MTVNLVDSPTAFAAEFHVAGIPKAQPRARAFARRMGDRFVARVFDDGSSEGWKGLVAVAAAGHAPPAPLETALSVELDFYLPRPKSRCRAKDPQGAIWCTSKPDCDNLAKAILDCLTQQGWWRDDAQVVRLAIEKHWHAKDGRPGMSVRVSAAPLAEFGPRVLAHLDPSRPRATSAAGIPSLTPTHNHRQE